MLNILVGSFTTESNTKVPYKTTMQNYDIRFNEDALKVMELENCEQRYNVHVIPSIYANANAAALVEFEAFDYIEKKLLNTIKDHINEIDGIYLHLHGASYVENIGSGDHHILKVIRELVGPYVPICVACDPHGNLTKEYVEATQCIRSYRESPHTDSTKTRRKVAKFTCDLVKNRQNIHSIYRKLPLILGGEQSVSADEPVLSINKYMDEMEKDPRVLSCSWHVGYLRHDCPEAGCGIVVVPATENDIEYCEQKADELAKYVWDKRHEFHYTGYTAEPEKALEDVLNFNGKPCVITDSGDNTTSGAKGWNTTILRQILACKSDKTFLIASINDPSCEAYLEKQEIGSVCHIDLGVGVDELNAPVPLDVKVLYKGEVVNPVALGNDDLYKVTGQCVTVHVENTNIDIVVANNHKSYQGQLQFKKAGIEDWKEYDCVVVKQGYIFPELKANAAFYVMSLTDGPTPQNTAKIPFKLIMRPMYPIDNI